jgi:hypothetical protein
MLEFPDRLINTSMVTQLNSARHEKLSVYNIIGQLPILSAMHLSSLCPLMQHFISKAALLTSVVLSRFDLIRDTAPCLPFMFLQIFLMKAYVFCQL